MAQWEYCRIDNGGQNEIAYVIYKVDNTETRVIVELDDTNFIKTWRTLIAELGLSGWEVIQIFYSPNEGATWYFKRIVQEGNKYLTV